MSSLVSRGLLLSPLVCGALVFGPLGTAAAAVDVSRPSSGAAVAAWSSTDTKAVSERIDVLDRANHHSELTPLLDVLSTLAEREAGPLEAGEAAGLARAVETANGSLQERLKERAGAAGDRAAAAADPVSDLLANLQSAIDELVKSLTSLDLGGVLGSVTGLLTPVLDLVTGLLGGATSAVPAAPAAPQLPALPASGSPADVS
ncbi:MULTISPECIES: hypothetical protein [unclassified Streptomyces]|uniref:hypothetical protein n=1 Tax=unclassified Streptomyces TaxID=2593676 RepID=UPI003664CCAD